MDSIAMKVTDMVPGKDRLENVSLWGLQSIIPMIEAVHDHIESNQEIDGGAEKMMHLLNQSLVNLEETTAKLNEYDQYIGSFEERIQADETSATVTAKQETGETHIRDIGIDPRELEFFKQPNLDLADACDRAKELGFKLSEIFKAVEESERARGPLSRINTLSEIDSMIGEFSEQMKKLSFCREMIDNVTAAGRVFEPENEAGLGFILADVEAGFDKLRQGISGLSEHGEEEA